jgi:Tfp pilus assembly protein PilF
MILSGLNRQNVEGTCEFLREFRVATEGKMKFQVILSPMPNGEDKLLDDRRIVAEAAFQGAWGAAVDLSLEIPYHPQLALTEEPHIFRRRRGYLFEAYRAIEASMLKALGHDAQTFHRRIRESLEAKDYGMALRGLRHMIRLDEGGVSLSRLTEQLTRPQVRPGSETEPPQEPISIRRLLKEEGGLAVVEFIVDSLTVSEWNWLTSRLLQELKRSSPELGDRLLERILESARTSAETLDSYATFLESTGYPDDAEVFHKRAVEADPKHARCLGNYARFLNLREDIDGAEAFYKRAIEADPRDAYSLSCYAVLLDYWRGDTEAAEVFHKRATESGPGNGAVLSNYAMFLKVRRGNMDTAASFFQRSIEADPMNAFNLSRYAVFLENRGDTKAAEALHKRAIEVRPNDTNLLANYGELLAGLLRLPEAERTLLSAFEHRDTATPGDTAEVCFSLWLVSRLQEHAAERWERYYKFLIQRGFRRYPWNFDRMLRQAEKKLSSGELEYAKALALAYLHESKLPELERHERWRKLEPLDPKSQETITPTSAA